MSETTRTRTPEQERDRRITRAVTWLGRWDQGETIATCDGRTLRYSDLAALVEAYQDQQRTIEALETSGGQRV